MPRTTCGPSLRFCRRKTDLSPASSCLERPGYVHRVRPLVELSCPDDILHVEIPIPDEFRDMFRDKCRKTCRSPDTGRQTARRSAQEQVQAQTPGRSHTHVCSLVPEPETLWIAQGEPGPARGSCTLVRTFRTPSRGKSRAYSQSTEVPREARRRKMVASSRQKPD